MKYVPHEYQEYYCEEHAKLHLGDRITSSGRGYDSRWRRARSRFLKAHPLCEKCREQGEFVKATVVDLAKTGNKTAAETYAGWYQSVYLPTPKTAEEGQG